ncbi:hypothetical protein [Metabacillus fastidiosus]|uniref:hypothetical protein n=1 Tax=Metabacillus fastidiosus TaxID=1458 RepID=UPI002DB7876C|nr:hypothetical protein [Metabacillus fastidiosus]MEC2076111.1 hypothetical protein [Metabacillus fastidiosus]
MDMLPEVRFEYKRKEEWIPYSHISLSVNQMVNSNIIIDEYQKCRVRFESNDPNACLEIETYEEEIPIQLKPREEVVIMKGGNTDDMLVPGHYPFKITSNNHIYEGFYTIKSKHFSNESLLNLRIYLEKMLRGLSYDLMRQRSGTFKNTIDLSPSIIQVYNHISDQYRVIKLQLELIGNDPITDITKVYRERMGSKRPDVKSLRWLSKKGGAKNPNLMMPTIVNEKQSTLTVNTIENQWIVHIVNYILRALRQLDGSFTDHIAQLQQKVKIKQQEISQLGEELSVMSEFGYEKVFPRKKANIDRHTKDIKQIEEDISRVDAKKRSIRQMISTFARFRELSWIQEVSEGFPRKQTIRLTKDVRYGRLLRFYKDLTKMKQKKANIREKGVPFKRTWQLFEYYSLGLVIQSLKELGYDWTEGWLVEKDNSLINLGTLTKDTLIRFEKDDHYIEVAYDTEIENPTSDISYSRYVDDTGKRPDIRLTIFKKENEEIYSEQASLVIDAKCRYHRYLFHSKENITTDVIDQLRGYRRLEYYNSLTHRSLFPVVEVICLYPRQEGVKPITKRLMDESLVFIQIEPTDPTIDEKPFGYDLLNQRLLSFIKRVVGQEKVVS